jgi:hypothetical protein
MESTLTIKVDSYRYVFPISHLLAREKDLPPLTEPQLSKLRHLTIISMSQKKRVFSFIHLVTQSQLLSLPLL